MRSYLYVVYDDLSNSFGSFVEYRTDDAAIRDFSKIFEKDVVKDPSSYYLYRVAAVDREDKEVKVVPEERHVVYTYSAYLSYQSSSREILSKITSQLSNVSDEDLSKVLDFISSEVNLNGKV